MQLHITGLPSNAHAIPPHACPHITGHTAPLAYHTHLCHHTPALTALCTHSVSHANATRVAHRCTCTFIYTQHNHVAHLHINTRSTHAHTQNMNTCQCWSTHILTHTHECTHTYMHARTKTHTHTCIHLTPQALSSKLTLYGTDKHIQKQHWYIEHRAFIFKHKRGPTWRATCFDNRACSSEISTRLRCWLLLANRE